MPEPTIKQPLYTERQRTRFWRNVALGDPEHCWNWKLSTHQKGHGQVSMRIDGRDYLKKAHRVAWEMKHDVALPKEVHALHTCFNKICCNPAHITVATNPEVALNTIRANQARGERHGMAKLTDHQVRIIKYRLGDLTTQEVADAFRIPYKSVYDIRTSRTWKHI